MYVYLVSTGCRRLRTYARACLASFITYGIGLRSCVHTFRLTHYSDCFEDVILASVCGKVHAPNYLHDLLISTLCAHGECWREKLSIDMHKYTATTHQLRGQ